MSLAEEKREKSKYTVVDELVDVSPIFAKDFKKLFGFPNVIGNINRALEYIRLEGVARIQTQSMNTTYEIDSVGVRREKVFIESKFGDWETARSEVIMLRRHGRKAYLITKYDKPRIRVYLEDYDELEFYRGDNY